MGEPVAYALFAHCFTCSKDLKAAGWICRALAERGIAVLRFDFSGVGGSEGEGPGGFASNLEDVVAAADFLRRERAAPSLLVGHSLGGTAVLAAASRIPEVRAVATIGAPSDLDHLRNVLLRRVPELKEGEEATVDLGGVVPVRVRPELLAELAGEPMRGVMANLHKPLLLFHSPVDNVVGIEHARRLFEEAKHPKSFVSLAGADHLLSRERDARYVADVLAAWAEPYLEGVDTVVEKLPEEGKAGEVMVIGGATGFTQEIIARRHRLIADEPLDVPGGTDTGPTPYDLLLAAIGACTSMTLRMYANLKKLPLEGVRVRLRTSKIHAADCAKCETKIGKLDRIEREIEVLGPLTDEQRLRLLEIADRCPVHRTLTSEIEIVSRLI
jgi:putative redox protein